MRLTEEEIKELFSNWDWMSHFLEQFTDSEECRDQMISDIETLLDKKLAEQRASLYSKEDLKHKLQILDSDIYDEVMNIIEGGWLD